MGNGQLALGPDEYIMATLNIYLVRDTSYKSSLITGQWHNGISVKRPVFLTKAFAHVKWPTAHPTIFYAGHHQYLLVHIAAR